MYVYFRFFTNRDEIDRGGTFAARIIQWVNNIFNASDVKILYYRISYSVMDDAYDRCEFFPTSARYNFSNILSRVHKCRRHLRTL